MATSSPTEEKQGDTRANGQASAWADAVQQRYASPSPGAPGSAGRVAAQFVEQRLHDSHIVYPKYDHGSLTGLFLPEGKLEAHTDPEIEAIFRKNNPLVFVNGMYNTSEEHCRSAQYLAVKSQQPVIGVYNHSGAIRSFADDLGYSNNPAIRRVRGLIMDRPDLHIVAHSDGSLVTAEALREASEGDRTDSAGTRKSKQVNLSRAKIDMIGSQVVDAPPGPDYLRVIDSKDFMALGPRAIFEMLHGYGLLWKLVRGEDIYQADMLGATEIMDGARKTRTLSNGRSQDTSIETAHDALHYIDMLDDARDRHKGRVRPDLMHDARTQGHLWTGAITSVPQFDYDYGIPALRSIMLPYYKNIQAAFWTLQRVVKRTTALAGKMGKWLGHEAAETGKAGWNAGKHAGRWAAQESIRAEIWAVRQAYATWKFAIARGSQAARAVARSARFVASKALSGAKFVGKEALAGAEFAGQRALSGATFLAHETLAGAKFVGNAAVAGAMSAAQAGANAWHWTSNKADAGIHKAQQWGHAGLNWLHDAKQQVWPTDANDGDLTGPFFPHKPYPKGALPVAKSLNVAMEQAFAEYGDNVAVFVNGVNTDLRGHSLAAQRLANATNSVVIGVYNATGISKSNAPGQSKILHGIGSALGFVRDLAQCAQDKFTDGGSNPAVANLTQVLKKHGASRMTLYAHSQGTIITADALWQMRRSGNSLRGYDVTTFGNAAFVFPDGPKYHHFASDSDIVPTFTGTNSFIASGLRTVWKTGVGKRLLNGWYGAPMDARHEVTTLHHSGGFIDPHDLNAITNSDDLDTKVHTQDYIGNLPAFRAKEARHLKPDAPGLLPLRAAYASGFALERGLGSLGAGLVGKLYGDLNAGMRKIPGQTFQDVWGKTDTGLRAVGRGALKAGHIAAHAADRGFERVGAVQRRGFGREWSGEPGSLRAHLLRSGGGGGTALPGHLRAALAPALGFDPGMARLHHGAASTQAARDMNAEAFTIGRDVFFGEGRYRPLMREGVELLSHELTHVGQQTGVIGSPARFFTPHGGDAMEREAQQTAERVWTHVGQREGLRVDAYTRVYEAQGDSALTAQHKSRLDSISLNALREAGEMLRQDATGSDVVLDDLEINISLNLSELSDEQAARIWAEAIVAGVQNRSAQAQETWAGSGRQHAMGVRESQTSEMSAPSLPEEEYETVQASLLAPQDAAEGNASRAREAQQEWMQRQTASKDDKRFAKMSHADRLGAVLMRTTEKLPDKLADQLEALISPESLAKMAGTLGLWAVSHFFGVGEALDLGLGAWAAYEFGKDAPMLMKNLVEFGTRTWNLNSEDDLNYAAGCLAAVISKAGINALMSFLHAKAVKAVKGRLKPGGKKPDAPKPPHEPELPNPQKPSAPQAPHEPSASKPHEPAAPKPHEAPLPKPTEPVAPSKPRSSVEQTPLEQRGYRPKPGERSMTRDQARLKDWERRTEARRKRQNADGNLRQKTGDLKTLYHEAEVAQKELAEVTHGIAQKVGGKADIPPQLKGAARAQEKIDSAYKGDASRVTDLSRASVVCDNMEQVQAAMAAIRKNVNVVGVKNRFDKPLNGYRDILLNVKMSNGHIAELQIQLRSIWNIKNFGEGHALYEKIRTLQAEAKIANRALTAAERAEIKQLNTKMKSLYDQAYQQGSGHE